MSKGRTLSVTGQAMSSDLANNGFTQIANNVLLDERLSFKARGILALLLSRPKGWKIYLDEVSSRSGKDGKRSVQSGFRELVDAGYVELMPVYNDETGRFQGTCYQLKNAFFPTTTFQDRPEIRPSEFQADDNSDRPETASLSNTENSNTENSKKEQQQQQRADDAVFEKKEIQFFQQRLHTDADWQKHFLGQAIGDGVFLSKDGLRALFHHFSHTSSQAGQTYSDLSEVKKHFTNWFQSNLAKNALPSFIAQYEIELKKARTIIINLLPKTEQLMLKIQNRTCESELMVLRLKEKLEMQISVYRQRLPLLSIPEESEAIQALMADMGKLIDRINRGQQAKKLSWFCERR